METKWTEFRQHIISQLLLVRMLLPSKHPPGPQQVRLSLGTLLGCTLTDKSLAPIREQLLADGYLLRTPRKAYRLTDAGRQQALKFLGLKTLPPQCNWRMVRSRYLVGALIHHWEQEHEKKATSPKTILPSPPRPRVRGGSIPPHTQEYETISAIDLPQFAQAVLQHANSRPPQERFGPNKAFISCVWQATQADPTFPRMDLDTFKRHLTAAHHQGLLYLSRADLVQAMNPQLVAQSETHYLNGQFHFILLQEPAASRRN
jgi:hypothetical protein